MARYDELSREQHGMTTAVSGGKHCWQIVLSLFDQPPNGWINHPARKRCFNHVEGIAGKLDLALVAPRLARRCDCLPFPVSLVMVTGRGNGNKKPMPIGRPIPDIIASCHLPDGHDCSRLFAPLALSFYRCVAMLECSNSSVCR